jgi:hypothetical protein
LVDLAGGIKAILRIPIVGNSQIKYIEYSRIYFEANQPDIENNDGALIEKKIGLGVFPLITFPEKVKKHYRIALFDKGQKDIQLMCYSGVNTIKIEANIPREHKNYELNECSKEAYVINENFDRIDCLVGDVIGVIVPKFKTISGNRIYTFAVDFGTTNTHIEYSFVTNKTDINSVISSFDILNKEKQLHRLHTLYVDRDINGAFEHNFIPDTIADNDDFHFPMRTVFSEWNCNNRKQKNYALANGNIPFLYEKELFPDSYNEVRTELKWRGEEDFPLVKLYLENIFLLLRNKVLQNGGSLEETKIIWFYPATMDTGRCNEFNQIWTQLYQDFFGSNSDNNLITISESTAPYRYYSRKKGAKSNVVSIDVGGGTTDVFVVENNEPRMLLSFLFASNAVFGDAFKWDSDSNGFVNLYVEPFSEILKSCKQDELNSILGQISGRRNSVDIIAFFFSLSNNRKLKENDALNFSLKLSQNRKLKYLFIIFYGAILYFIAKSMKNKGLKRPLTLAFSGNGSKTLRVLSPDNKTIGEFAKFIFNTVFQDHGTTLDIIFEDEPKKATCKGGVLDPIRQTPSDIKALNYTLIGDDLDKKPDPEARIKYDQLTEETKTNIIDSVLTYLKCLFEIHEKNDEFLTHSLGADDAIFEKVKEIATNRVELMESLLSALNTKKSNKVIEETLFFYPLIEILHKIALEISTN